MMVTRLLVVLVLTVCSTVIHGRMTYRWGTPPELQTSDAIVRDLPKELGDWKYVNDGNELTDGVIAELGVSEYISRQYVRGDDSVTVLLMSGKTGRLVRHTPDICYGAVGNTFLKEPAPVTLDVDGKQHEFRVLPIRMASGNENEIVVVYGFGDEGQFLSPATPRLTYRGRMAVQKVQVLCKSEPDRLGQIPLHAAPFVEELCRYLQTR